jgi:hypothetical protein
MIFKNQLSVLKPKGHGGPNPEPFDSYFARIEQVIPNFPRSVVQQLIYRHYSDMVIEYAWLLTDVAYSFRRASLPTARIIAEVNTHKMDDVVDPLGQKILSESRGQQSWLQEYMLTERTWPTPIIVLDNRGGMKGPRGQQYGVPMHLLEGHLRLGYLRALRDSGTELRPNHELWAVFIDKGI